jgi:hypothetical protein
MGWYIFLPDEGKKDSERGLKVAGYTKLFSSIVTSTIWCEDYPTRLVWISMLAMKNWDGVVEGSVPGFARIANVTVPEMEHALSILLNPDHNSRTPDNEGRRIELVQGGWRVLNHELYREQDSPEYKRAQAADRQRRFRENNGRVTQRNATERHTDTDTEAVHQNQEKEYAHLAQQKTPQTAGNALLSVPGAFDTFWEAYPRKTAKQAASRAFQKLSPSQEMLKTLLSALEAQKKQDSWVKDGGAFIPHPSTWLNGKRWEDQILSPAGTQAKPGDPGYEVTDVDRVIAAYRNAKKIPKDDDEWRTIMWERQRPDARALLDYFAGDWRAAVDCISATVEKCEGMDWGWRAVMGRAPEIKNREVSR